MKLTCLRFWRQLLLLLITTTIIACGGGSGSSSSSASTTDPDIVDPDPDPVDDSVDPDPDPVDDPVDPDPEIHLKMVEGQVTDSTGTPLAATNVAITLKSDDDTELMSLNAESDDNGNYQILIPSVLTETPVALESAFKKDGFSAGDYYTELEDNVVARVDATLAQAYSVSIKREDLENLAFSADGVPTLRISLLSNTEGQKRIVVGEALAADDEVTELSLDLPTDQIDSETEVINAEIATFDSGDPDQLASYPGEFSAQGDVSTGEGQEGVDYTRDDSSGESNDLVSTTFFDVNLTDQDGNALEADADQASASATSYPSLMRYASPSVYKRIYSDVDPSNDGIQFPFFVKRNSRSKWQYVGNGTLVDRSGTPVGPDHATYPVGIDADGSVNFPDGANYRLYFKIEITRWNSWIRYINVDYYTLNMGGSQQPVNMCFTGTVEYGGGDAYEGTMYFRSPDYGYYRVRIANGKFEFNRSISPRYADPLDINSWSNWSGRMYGKNYRRSYRRTWYSWWSRRTYSYWYTPWEHHQLNTAFTSDTLVSADNGCNEIQITMVNPAHCVVDGYVYAEDGTTPLSGEIVSISAGSATESVLTNANGYYRKAAWCDADYTVSAVSKVGEFTVNAQNSPYTQSFVDDNRDPIVALFIESRPVLYQGDETTVEWFTSDPEGDSLSVNISHCESDTTDCGITVDGNRATLSFAEAGTYDFELSVSDSRNTVIKETTFDVEVPDANRAPGIRGFNVGSQFVEPGGVASVVQNSDVDVSVVAVDSNGDVMTYSWTDLDDCTTATCLLSFSSLDDYILEVTVADEREGDDGLSSSGTLVVTVVEDLPPTVEIQLSDANFIAMNNVNIVPVVATLSAIDDLTSAENFDITWSLSKDDSDITDQITDYFFSDFNMSIPPGAMGQGDYELSVDVTEQLANGDPGQTVTATASFHIVDDLPPSIELRTAANELYGTSSGGTESNVQFTAAASDNESSPTITWDVPSPLQFTRSGNTLQILAASLVPGSYTISATATDSTGQAVTVERTIEVMTDEVPVIDSLTVTPESQIADVDGQNVLAITATVEASDDLSTPTVSNWTVSSAVNSVSRAVNFTNSGSSISMAAGDVAAGTYTATATVADHRGQTSSDSVSFEVIERDGNIEIIIE